MQPSRAGKDARSALAPLAAGTDSVESGGDLGTDDFFCVIRATPDDVRHALRSAVARFARVISSDDAGALELTLAEVLNNVVEHAYADAPGGPVVLQVSREAGHLSCRVTDRGRPMPESMMTVAATHLTDVGPGEVRFPSAMPCCPAEGGYGWPLICAMTENLDYARRGHMNVLTFRLSLSAA